MTTLTAPHGEISFGPGQPVLLINDQLRVIDQRPTVLAELRQGKFDQLLELARVGLKHGAMVVDILISHQDLDEVALLPAIARVIQEEIGCPVSLDSRNPMALEVALQVLEPYKAMINSVTAEPASLQIILPLAKKYGAVIIGMPVGELYGLPKTVEGRLAEGRTILEAALRMGIPHEDVVLDAVCLAPAVEPGSFQVTMETVRAFHDELQTTTILGIGNAGYGMPEPGLIDLGYLTSAISWGLDAALVDPATPGLAESVRAMDFLTGRDPWGKKYLQVYRKKRRQSMTSFP
jgi:5-methyltetrahydrofolate--homocysteine methyltransferase